MVLSRWSNNVVDKQLTIHVYVGLWALVCVGGGGALINENVQGKESSLLVKIIIQKNYSV